MRKALPAAGLVIGVVAALFTMAGQPGASPDDPALQGEVAMDTMEDTDTTTKEAIFAGGCFWCMESLFEFVPGVLEAISGYTGGDVENPTYEQVTTGTTGHFEAVLVRYDPAQTSYEELLDEFWRNVNPTDAGGQFHDRGSQYNTAIFILDEEQRALAEASKRALEASGVFDEPIVTKILPAQAFYPAEDYHQGFYKNYLARYKAYSTASGREAYFDETWQGQDDVTRLRPTVRPWEDFVKPSEDELRQMLTPLQYSVTQENGTERAFQNEYWDNHEEGIYVDVVSGEPLFSSEAKFDSGLGWPSFTRPIAPDGVVAREDTSHGMVRVEVRSRIAESHLGHLFEDGPPPTGERYCIDSAALRFVPKESLEEEGYGEYLDLFE